MRPSTGSTHGRGEFVCCVGVHRARPDAAAAADDGPPRRASEQPRVDLVFLSLFHPSTLRFSVSATGATRDSEVFRSFSRGFRRRRVFPSSPSTSAGGGFGLRNRPSIFRRVFSAPCAWSPSVLFPPPGCGRFCGLSSHDLGFLASAFLHHQ